MTWDATEDTAITIARLMASPAEQVYQELREYADYQIKHLGLSADGNLEKTLLDRAEPLINLGLGQFAGSTSVVRLLYTRAREGTGNPVLDRAVRLACLSNRHWPEQEFLGERPTVLDNAETRRLAESGDDAEVRAILNNPAQKLLLQNLFNQKPPFENIPTDRLANLISVASWNSAVEAESKDSGTFASLRGFPIQNGIYTLLAKAPVETHWMQVLAGVLWRINDPACPEGDPRPVIERWKSLAIDEKAGRGRWTSMSRREEFLCLVAALYGTSWIKLGEFAVLGSLGDQDPIMRYAFYGHGALTVGQMVAAYQKDGEGFILAALCNNSLLRGKEKRATLERLMAVKTNLELARYYYYRCKAIHAGHKEFDPRPVSEWCTKLLEQVIEDKPSEERKQLKTLEDRVSLLQHKMQILQRYAGWVIVILAFIAVMALVRR